MNYLYYIIGSFVSMCISGCFTNYPYHDVYISNITPSIDKIDVESRNVQSDQKIFADSGGVLLSTFKKDNLFNRNYHHSYDYSNQASYSSCCYTVKPGDTLFYIAWITGNDYHVLADKNNISVYDVLQIGQVLQVNCENQQLNNKCFNKKRKSNSRDMEKKCDVSSCCLNTSKVDNYAHNNVLNNKHCSVPTNKKFINLLSLSSHDLQSSKKSHLFVDNKEKTSKEVLSVVSSSTAKWTWPASGKIISGFSAIEGGNKGINISGTVGQPIFSTRSGKVVYAGNDLAGYGNLIIIKHNDDFLSTYAHNDTILVVEQQYVNGGQKIATMGSSESDTIKLYFEIRHKGKSVDPLYYLPKR